MVRKAILEALKTRLEDYDWQEWSPNGVYLGRTMFDPDHDPLPLLTIVADTDVSSRTAYRTNRREMTVNVSALVSLADGATVFDDCEPIYGEIEKACFHGGDIDIGTVAAPEYSTIEFRGGGIISYPDEIGPAVVTVGVSLAVTYETEIGDPTN